MREYVRNTRETFRPQGPCRQSLAAALTWRHQKKTLAELEGQMSLPDFWGDANRARRVSQEAAEIRKELEEAESVQKELRDAEEYLELQRLEAAKGRLERSEGSHEDEEPLLRKITEVLDKLEFRTLFSGPYDANNALVDLHAGSGGTEANDWTAMLLRMYLRYAEKKGWKVEVLAESRAEEVGFKSVSLRVEGRFVYGHLKAEAGVHRLVRISPFDAEKMRHTTFALVDVVPEFEDVPELDIDPKDLRIDTFLSGGHGGQSVQTTYSAVRIVHIPTGITVSCQNERSQAQNKETAMKVLLSRLYQRKLDEQAKKVKDIRGNVESAAWGNQIRSYVLYPYKMVKDHRTEAETTDAQTVLDGDLDFFVESYLRSLISSKI